MSAQSGKLALATRTAYGELRENPYRQVPVERVMLLVQFNRTEEQRMDTRHPNDRTRQEKHDSGAPAPDDSANREKLLSRIRKLYAMSRESESSPHEAEIAMRRCQSLMSRFGITESDLETSEFGASKIGKAFRSIPGYVGVLGSAVALLHDCICVRSDTIEFRGFSIDAEVASLTYDYLSDAMERSLKEHKRRGTVEPGRSASFDYRVGFSLAVLQRARQLDAERRSHEEQAAAAAGRERAGPGSSLVVRKRELVRNACMEGLVTRRAARVRYRNGRAHEAGTSDGSRVSLDKQMGNVKRKAVKG
ncbi:MAG: DUF2786 domain-containing protein [Granulosicoccus sp.]